MSENTYYIAKIGEMWVDCLYQNLDKLSLTKTREFAVHLNEDQAIYVKEATGAIILKVKVTIDEIETP